jgi:DNA segregation ATPase FtsK/SpoIIIE, S-DNA-T family
MAYEVPTVDTPDQDAEVIPLRRDEDPEPQAPPEPPVPEPAAGTGKGYVPAPGERRPIIPMPLKRANLKATVRFAVGLSVYRTVYHGIRSPWHLLKILWFAVLGLAGLTGRLLAHVNWVDGWLLESSAVADGGRDGHQRAMHAVTKGSEIRSRRWQITGLIAAGVAVAVLAAAIFAPWWVWLPVVPAVVLVLAHHGKPHGRPMISRAVVPARYEAPTTEIIMRALGSLGISLLTKAVDAGAQLVITPGVHRDGPGWCARIELPHGVTAVDVISKREALASALRRPLSATWPAPLPHEHPGMLELWIGFSALNKQTPVAWPLTKAGKADLFGEIPFGADQRGKLVKLTLMFASVLIGAMPRMGKTMALRILALACALDPSTRLRVWELKGTGDLAALKHVAHEYGSGADEETLDACLASVRAYHKQLEVRAKALRELPAHLVPENKVTAEIAADRKLGLFPDVLIIDEVQEALTDPDRKAEFEFLLTAITKRGPALGMILLLATQRPDAKSLPTGISSNILIRFCLKVMGYASSNMVLGDGMSTAGYNAADFVRSDKGIGWLTGEADDPVIVRTCYIDATDADVIAKRARAARLAAGTLSGYALGEAPITDGRSFLEDALAVFHADAKLWSETIAARLREEIPEVYASITPEAVASQLRDAGVRVKDVREPGKQPRKGCEREAIENAAGLARV